MNSWNLKIFVKKKKPGRKLGNYPKNIIFIIKTIVAANSVKNKNMKKTKTTENQTKQSLKKTLVGIVTSDKMKDTIVVKVSRFVKHPKYGKYVSHDKKFKADDKGNTKKVGDRVTIIECAPISKDKHFKLI